MAAVQIPDFLPSSRGFRFANTWAHMPMFSINIAGLSLPIGDAANGLCGGMSFTMADAYHARLPKFADATNPGAGHGKYEYIVGRQIDSFAGIAVPLRFYDLMRTSRPEREPPWAGPLSWLGVDRHSRSYVMVHDEWPRVRKELDAGRPALLGLVRTISDDVRMLGHNHQVMAYGYDVNGNRVSIRICDPNWPEDDGVTLSFDAGDPNSVVRPSYSKLDGEVYCFFLTPYERRDPLPWRGS
jgi:hypothetical protein